MAQNEDNHDVFSLLEADLDINEQEGKPVAENLAKVARSRFAMKLPEQKLKEKLDRHLILKNYTEIRAPVLNAEIVEKGNLARIGLQERTTLVFSMYKSLSRKLQPL